MYVVRFYGRGGQGAVTASKLLGVAALLDGKFATSVGRYGGERRGAPVDVFLRIADEPIRAKSFPSRFDSIITSDPKLQAMVDITEGFEEGGVAVLNTKIDPEEISLKVTPCRIGAVDATGLALQIFGPSALPITSTAMIGAFSRTTGMVSLDSILRAIREEWKGRVAEMNVTVTERGYEETRVFDLDRREA